MTLEELKTPGYLPNAMQLRSAAFRAIGYASVQADMTNGESDTAATLREFFLDCAKHCEPTPIPVPAKAAKKETA
jgi:hypothetical protein